MRYNKTTKNALIIIVMILCILPFYDWQIHNVATFDDYIGFRFKIIHLRIIGVAVFIQLLLTLLLNNSKWKLIRQIRVGTKWLARRVAENRWLALFCGWLLSSYVLNFYIDWILALEDMGAFYLIFLLPLHLVLMLYYKTRKNLFTGASALYFWFWMSIGLTIALVSLTAFSYSGYDGRFTYINRQLVQLERFSFHDVEPMILYCTPLILIIVFWIVERLWRFVYSRVKKE